MEASYTLVTLKRRRENLKRNITELKSRIEQDGASSECRLHLFGLYFNEINNIQNKIEKLDKNDSNRADIEELFISTKSKPRKSLTLCDRMKAIRLYKKVGSYKTLSDLFGVANISSIIRKPSVMNYYKQHPLTHEPQIEDIIIPKVQLIIKPEQDILISAVTLKNVELVAQCVCEALKREQLFTYNVRRKRTKEFADIIFKDEPCQYWAWLIRLDYTLRFANEEIPQKFEVLPVAVDLHEILCYCLKKLEMENNEKAGSSLANPQYPTTDFEHLQVTSYSDVDKLLNSITDFATLCDNKNGLEYIFELKKHIARMENF